MAVAGQEPWEVDDGFFELLDRLEEETDFLSAVLRAQGRQAWVSKTVTLCWSTQASLSNTDVDSITWISPTDWSLHSDPH